MGNKEIKDYMVVPNTNTDPRNYDVSRFIPGEHIIDDVEFMLDLPKKEIVMKQFYGSCVGHAYAMAKKISEYQKTKKWIDFDPYIIYGTRFDGDYKGKGMMIDQGAKALYKEGAFYERNFGVHKEMPSIMIEVEAFKELHPDLVEEAKAFKIEGYAYVDPTNVDEMKTALKAGMPIIISINAWNQMGGATGIIHSNTKTGSNAERHAVCIIGWRTINERPYWIIVNSWGIYQGDRGLLYWDSRRKIFEAVSISDTITPVKSKCDRLTFSIGEHAFIADGEYKPFKVAPYIKNNRTFLPVRFIAENMGASVEWNAKTGVATIRSEEAVLTITHKSNIMTINGIEYKMDVRPEIVNDIMMAPIRFIAEALNCKVEWVGDKKMVCISAL